MQLAAEPVLIASVVPQWGMLQGCRMMQMPAELMLATSGLAGE
jgi:hypothetical protein